MRNVAPTHKLVRLVSASATPEAALVIYEHRTNLKRAWITRAKGDPQGAWEVHTDEGCMAQGMKKADAIMTACEYLL